MPDGLAARLRLGLRHGGATPPVRLLGLLALVSLAAAVAFAAKIVHDRRYVYTLRLATGGPGGDYHAFGETLKTVIEAHHYDRGSGPRIQIRLVTNTGGSRDNMDLLERGKVDLALAQNDTPAKASVRSIALLFPEVFHLYVRADAGVTNVAGLKGKRIATLPERSGTYLCLQRLLQHYRLTGGDGSVELLPLSPSAAHRAFRGGEVDAVFHAIALGATAREHIGRSLESGAVLLPIEQVAALRTHYPYLEPAIIPKGCYRGDPPIPARDIPTAAVRAVLLVHSDIPRSVVYRLTHILHAHRSEIVSANPMAAELGPPGTPDQGLFPLHAGAQAYYSREKPGFVVTYAEPLALGLSLSALFASGLWHLRLRLQQGRKNRADMYNLEILRLVKQSRQVEDLGELDAVRQKLYDIFGRVLEDLDRDKISTESFQFFAFPWGVAIGAIRHRELTLTNRGSTDEGPARDEEHGVDA